MRTTQFAGGGAVVTDAQSAHEGVVLLGNPRGLLPLVLSEYQATAGEAGEELAVVGPNIENNGYGNYAAHNDNSTNPLQGLQRLVPGLVFAKGMPSVASTNRSGFAAAVAVARRARVTVAVFGIDNSQEHETGTRSDITLPGLQVGEHNSLLAGQGGAYWYPCSCRKCSAAETYIYDRALLAGGLMGLVWP